METLTEVVETRCLIFPVTFNIDCCFFFIDIPILRELNNVTWSARFYRRKTRKNEKKMTLEGRNRGSVGQGNCYRQWFLMG